MTGEDDPEGRDADADRLDGHLPDFPEDVMAHVYRDAGHVSVIPGDYGGADPEAFREDVVVPLTNHPFERDTGQVVILLGDMNGHAVFKVVEEPDDSPAEPETGRLYSCNWPRFEDEFDLATGTVDWEAGDHDFE